MFRKTISNGPPQDEDGSHTMRSNCRHKLLLASHIEEAVRLPSGIGHVRTERGQTELDPILLKQLDKILLR